MREMDENPGRRQQPQQPGNGGVSAGGTPTIKNVLELKSKYEAPAADEVPTCMYAVAGDYKYTLHIRQCSH